MKRIESRVQWISIIVVGLLAMSCATRGVTQPAEMREVGPSAEAQAPAAEPPEPRATERERSAPENTLPAEVRQALLPSMFAPIEESPETDDSRFDIAVHDASARAFFMNLVQDTSYDVVVHPEVTGTLSLTLKNATISEILHAVREVYGYEFERTPTGFYVLPARLASRVFPIDYINIQRKGVTNTRVSSGELSEQFSGSSSTSQGLGPTVSGGGSFNVIESSKVKTESSTDLWGELAASVRAIVGDGAGRSVVVSPQASILVVRAMPSELRQVAEFLGRAQNNLERQVIIEAKILEVQLDDGFRSGINWAYLITSGDKSVLGAQTGGGTSLENGASEISGQQFNLNRNSPGFDLFENALSSAFGGVFSAVLDLNKLTGFVELLETQGRVEVLSSPRISTVNNQKAVIKVGSDEFFVTDVSTTTVTGTVATTSPDVTLTPFFSGIALDVLPQISGDGEVILHVHPSISRVTDQEKSFTVGGEDTTIPTAISTIRETDSVIRARNGQVVVIGGLMQEREVDDSASIPWIGRIPYLGKLFGQNASATIKSELVVLLQPLVVNQKVWDEEVRGVRSRFESDTYRVAPENFFPGNQAP